MQQSGLNDEPENDFAHAFVALLHVPSRSLLLLDAEGETRVEPKAGVQGAIHDVDVTREWLAQCTADTSPARLSVSDADKFWQKHAKQARDATKSKKRPRSAGNATKPSVPMYPLWAWADIFQKRTGITVTFSHCNLLRMLQNSTFESEDSWPELCGPLAVELAVMLARWQPSPDEVPGLLNTYCSSMKQAAEHKGCTLAQAVWYSVLGRSSIWYRVWLHAARHDAVPKDQSDQAEQNARSNGTRVLKGILGALTRSELYVPPFIACAAVSRGSAGPNVGSFNGGVKRWQSAIHLRISFKSGKRFYAGLAERAAGNGRNTAESHCCVWVKGGNKMLVWDPLASASNGNVPVVFKNLVNKNWYKARNVALIRGSQADSEQDCLVRSLEMLVSVAMSLMEMSASSLRELEETVWGKGSSQPFLR